MLDYDFCKLNDKEFEAFTVDLLSQFLEKRLERFKAGKDRGVDGRFFMADGAEVILQCKHWPTTGIGSLIRNLRIKEAPKLDALKPTRYLFATSLPLSRKNKSDIQAALSPWIISPSDIFGQEDLNTILADHRNVEERHYKLWFSSVTILRRLQNVSITGRSEFKIEEAKAFALKYVVTSAHTEAMDKLDRLRAIIVTGEAGIGKSTLAEQIALQYALKDFEICCIADNVEEAESAWTKDTQQLFYFDDFLGRNYLLALDKHDDSHIVGLIKRVRSDPKKRFILTSRTTILNQGKSLTDLFRIENLDRNEYELNVKKLALIDKGRILYNHIWHSDLPAEYIDEFYAETRYLQVAQHSNYNPRLISFITDSHKIGTVTPTEYWNYVEETLKNPKDIWTHVFDRQLNDETRALVCLTVYNGRNIDEPLLKEAFTRYHSSSGIAGQFDKFQSAIRLAVGSVLNRNFDGGNDVVTFNLFNPSIGDFVTNRYRTSSPEISSFLLALQTEFSLRNFNALKHSKIISRNVFLETTSFLASRLLNASSPNIMYRLRLAVLCMEHETILPTMCEFIQRLLREVDIGVYADDQADLLCYGIETGCIDPESDEILVKTESLLMEGDLEEEAFRSISRLILVLTNIGKDDLAQKFTSTYVKTWAGKISEAVYNDGTLDDFMVSEESPRAKEKLKEYIQGHVGEIHLLISEDEIEEILNACDIDEIIRGNQERSWGDSDSPHSPSSNPVSDDVAAVHDLFDRGQ